MVDNIQIYINYANNWAETLDRQKKVLSLAMDIGADSRAKEKISDIQKHEEVAIDTLMILGAIKIKNYDFRLNVKDAIKVATKAIQPQKGVYTEYERAYIAHTLIKKGKINDIQFATTSYINFHKKNIHTNQDYIEYVKYIDYLLDNYYKNI